jgi:hypothetical protein
MGAVGRISRAPCGPSFIKGSPTAALGCLVGDGRLSDRALGCADVMLNTKLLEVRDWLRSPSMIAKSCVLSVSCSALAPCGSGQTTRARTGGEFRLGGDTARWGTCLVIKPVHSQGDEKALAISAKSEHGRCDVCTYLRAVFCQARFTCFDAECQM